MKPVNGLLRFKGLDAPVSLSVDERFIKALPFVFANWPHTVTQTAPQDAFASVTYRDKAYHIESPFLDKPARHKDPLNTLCALVVELAWARLRQDETLLCLHGGAVEFSGRLVLFPSTRKAGKSTLSVALAAAGKTVYTDDFLPLRVEEDGGISGLSSGISPRLRLPVPAQVGKRTKAYLKARGHISNRQYRYVRPKGAELAAFDDAAPVGALVFLERRDGARAHIEPASRADALKTLITQNFSRAINAAAILQVLAAITEEAPAYRLVYDRVEPAIALLEQTFANWDSPAPVFRAMPDSGLFNSPLDTPDGVAPDITNGQFLQAPGIYEVATDAERFLTGRNGKTIHYLNDGAAMIWRLLEEPTSLAEAIEMVAALFPEQPVAQITDDVTATLQNFSRNGLLLKAPEICHTGENRADSAGNRG